MKILITGGRGFVARNLKSLFEADQYEVRAPSRNELDLLNISKLCQYLKNEKFDAIIHAAAKGGKRTKKDTFDNVFIPNVQMFENLYIANMWRDPSPILILGSGAEFDRRGPIREVREEDVFNRWPIDPYGLSKNLIARRALTDFNRMYVLRLFGCFNWDDDPERFITSGILNVRRGLPIRIHRQKEMDYFFLDDVFLVMDHLIKNGGPRNINLVYDEKKDLMGIAKFIQEDMIQYHPSVKIEETGVEAPYTGNGEVLEDMNIPLIGLREGIRRTVSKLLSTTRNAKALGASLPQLR